MSINLSYSNKPARAVNLSLTRIGYKAHGLSGIFIMKTSDFNQNEWVDMIGWEGLYQVNILGQIKSIRKPSAVKLLSAFQLKKDWYIYYNLCKHGRTFSMAQHRAIAIHFIPNPNNLPFVNHINGLKYDNRIENLEWCSHRDNMRHAAQLGLIKKLQISKKMTHVQMRKSKRVCQYDNFGNLQNIYYSINEAARKSGIDVCTIHYMCTGKTKTPYRSEYTFTFLTESAIEVLNLALQKSKQL